MDSATDFYAPHETFLRGRLAESREVIMREKGNLEEEWVDL